MGKRIIFIFSMWIFNLLFIYGQQIKISGKVLDPENEPIEYVNVQLLDEYSVYITGTVSDQDGKINLSVTANRDYWLSFSAVGYAPKTIYLKGINAKTNLGNVILEESTVTLDGVTVTANQIIRQIDRHVAFPNALQYKSSNNALEILRNMHLPQLDVDVQQKKVSLIGGGNVLLKINGIQSTIQEVYALRTKDIIRIEYYDNSGVRFQEAGMIDFIVRRKESGGYIFTDLTNSLHAKIGDDAFSVKLNHKKSEWTFNYNLSYRNYERRWNNQETIYNYPDHHVVMKEEGIPAPFHYQTHDASLTYNYTLPDKRVFNVAASGKWNPSNQYYESFNYYSDNSSSKNQVRESKEGKVYNPILDIYYKENLSNTESLMFNAVGGYAKSNYHRDYIETNEYERLSSESKSIIDGDSYFFSGQSNYQKKWNKILLYSGAVYQYNYAKNNYGGSYFNQTTLKSNNLYLYSQLHGQWRKIYYGLGVGVNYYSINNQLKELHYWTFRPFFSLYYSPLKNMSLSYTFNSYPSNPSLSELSDVMQDFNMREVLKGNPNLKPYRNYSNQIQANYRLNTLQFYLGVNHVFYKNMIMPYIYFDSDMNKFVSTKMNQKHYQTFTANTQISWQIIPDMLNLTLQGMILWFDSKGIDYHHTYTSYYCGGQLNFYYKNWAFYAGAAPRYNQLSGETISYGAISLSAEVGYKYKDFYLGVGGSSLFLDNWSSGDKNLSSIVYNTSWTYIGDSAPLLGLHFSWDFSWGEKSKSERKEVNNKHTDTGILKVD